MHYKTYIWTLLCPNVSQMGGKTKKLTWISMKKINASGRLYWPPLWFWQGTRVGRGFLLPGWVQVSKFWNLGGSRSQSFATWVGPGFKVLLFRWVQFAKKWRRKLPDTTRLPGLPWNPGLGLDAYIQVLEVYFEVACEQPVGVPCVEGSGARFCKCVLHLRAARRDKAWRPHR